MGKEGMKMGDEKNVLEIRGEEVGSIRDIYEGKTAGSGGAPKPAGGSRIRERAERLLEEHKKKTEEIGRLLEEIRSQPDTEKRMDAVGEFYNQVEKSPDPGLLTPYIGKEGVRTSVICGLHLVYEKNGASNPAKRGRFTRMLADMHQKQAEDALLRMSEGSLEEIYSELESGDAFLMIQGAYAAYALSAVHGPGPFADELSRKLKGVLGTSGGAEVESALSDLIQKMGRQLGGEAGPRTAGEMEEETPVAGQVEVLAQTAQNARIHTTAEKKRIAEANAIITAIDDSEGEEKKAKIGELYSFAKEKGSAYDSALFPASLYVQRIKYLATMLDGKGAQGKEAENRLKKAALNPDMDAICDALDSKDNFYAIEGVVAVGAIANQHFKGNEVSADVARAVPGLCELIESDDREVRVRARAALFRVCYGNASEGAVLENVPGALVTLIERDGVSINDFDTSMIVLGKIAEANPGSERELMLRAAKGATRGLNALIANGAPGDDAPESKKESWNACMVNATWALEKFIRDGSIRESVKEKAIPVLVYVLKRDNAPETAVQNAFAAIGRFAKDGGAFPEELVGDVYERVRNLSGRWNGPEIFNSSGAGVAKNAIWAIAKIESVRAAGAPADSSVLKVLCLARTEEESVRDIQNGALSWLAKHGKERLLKNIEGLKTEESKSDDVQRIYLGIIELGDEELKRAVSEALAWAIDRELELERAGAKKARFDLGEETVPEAKPAGAKKSRFDFGEGAEPEKAVFPLFGLSGAFYPRIGWLRHALPSWALPGWAIPGGEPGADGGKPHESDGLGLDYEQETDLLKLASALKNDGKENGFFAITRIKALSESDGDDCVSKLNSSELGEVVESLLEYARDIDQPEQVAHILYDLSFRKEKEFDDAIGGLPPKVMGWQGTIWALSEIAKELQPEELEETSMAPIKEIEGGPPMQMKLPRPGVRDSLGLLLDKERVKPPKAENRDIMKGQPALGKLDRHNARVNV